MKNFLKLFLMLASSQAFAAPNPILEQDLVGSNMLRNGGFESGKADWTASGGATAAANSTAKGPGNLGFDWDSNSASQTLSSSLYAIPNSLKGRNALAYCEVKVPSGTATHTFAVSDGTNTIGSTTISNSTNFIRTPINFIAPTSGSLKVVLTSVASNEPEIYIDNCYLGSAINLTNVSQAQAIVMATKSAGQSITSTSNTTITTWGESLDVYNEFNATTGVYTATSSKRIAVSGYVLFGNQNSSELFAVKIFKGSTEICRNNAPTPPSLITNWVAAVPNCVFDVVAGDTVELKVSSASDTAYDVTSSGSLGTQFSILQFPSQQELAIRPELQYWKVDANISGANLGLGTSDQTSYIGIENGSLTLTNNSGNGNIAAQIPCSSTNAPSGTTCSAGNESVGIAFTPTGTFPQDVLACVSFAHNISGMASTEGVAASFEIVETPTNAQTISQEGKSRITSGGQSTNNTILNPLRVCGTFTFSSGGQKVLRLFYEQDVTGAPSTNSVLGDAISTVGQRDIHWEVYPINQGVPAPILIGSVTSNSTGAERIERAIFSNGAGGNCTSSPCTVDRQSGSWISSVVRNSTGNYTVNFNSGIFSSGPVCNCTATEAGAAYRPCGVGFPSSASLTITVNNDAGTAKDAFVNLICVGPK